MLLRLDRTTTGSYYLASEARLDEKVRLQYALS